MEDFMEHGKEYINAKVSLMKLEVAEQSAKLASNLIISLVIYGFSMLVLAILAISLIFLLKIYTDSYLVSSLIVFVLYALVGLLVFVRLKNRLTTSIQNKIYKSIIDEKESAII